MSVLPSSLIQETSRFVRGQGHFYSQVLYTTTSAHLKELHWQEEIWDATKGNATYVKVIKQAKSKDVSPSTDDFGELRSNIVTFCALLFTLFGKGCNLFWSNLEILHILSLPFLHAE